tara:strand:- start:327 stop:473 length:147 start_codon:yes stop_codon:yes gene_type:complete
MKKYLCEEEGEQFTTELEAETIQEARMLVRETWGPFADVIEELENIKG